MRYFFFSYNFSNDTGGTGFGNMSVSVDKFPSDDAIIEIIEEQDNVNGTIIMNFIEFKSKKDYELFTSKK